MLAFVDDDVTVESAWLHNLTAPLLSGRWAGCGGRILADWGGFAPPRWLPEKGRYHLGPLVIFDLGLEAGPLTEPPFGTNMAFRKGMFGKYGGFRTDLGPRPGSEIRREDTEFGRRLLAAGEQLWYEPSAIVQHIVPQSRLRKQYFLNWWFDHARTHVREFGLPPDNKASSRRHPAALASQACSLDGSMDVRIATFAAIFQQNKCVVNSWSNCGVLPPTVLVNASLDDMVAPV